jgi:hypothetical protein
LEQFFTSWLTATWQVIADSALYFLFGLVLAGLVWVFLNEKNLTRLLGKNRNQAVFRAAIIGVPLPLCSCSVLPVVTQLRNSGLGKGGTMSFLIATPESSIDSILLTYSLTDPLMTVARPIAAFLTASVAGLIENRFDTVDVKESSAPEGIGLPMATDVKAACSCCASTPETVDSWPKRVGNGIKHSFTTLISDLAPYLLLGYVLAGLAATFFGSPVDFGSEGGWMAYLAALVVGVPLYVCATSSTPLAAVLLGAGFPPGAIMVFLMVGPATNLTTLTVAKKILGLNSTIRYLVIIVVVSLICGLVLDSLYGWLQIAVDYQPSHAGHMRGWVDIVSGSILAVLIVWHVARKQLRRATA